MEDTLGADADLHNGEKEGGKMMNGSQIETVDSKLWDITGEEISWHQEDLHSRGHRDGVVTHRCARSLRPYKMPKRPRKAKGIESHSENSTASSSETLDDALPSPDRPVVGPSDTAHASITKVAAILTRASVVSTEKDKTSNVDVKGA